MSTAALPAIAAGPYATLQAQAHRAPQAEALRSRRRGEWRAWSWQRLAAQAELAARGWAALGVLPGDRIVALGPLGAELIVTLFAADALGATVVLAEGAAQAQAIGETRFAFADGTHELERLLRHRGARLRAAVVGDASVLPTSGQVDHVPLLGHAQLLASARAHEEPLAGAGRFPVAEVLTHDGAVHRLGSPQPAAPDLGLADRVFADFAPTWLAGLQFILHAWPVAAPLLLIPEPHGDAVADQRAARANVWLAPAERLAAVAEQLLARVPPRGHAAWAARAALDGRRSLAAHVARWRIRAGMGLAHTRHTVSDAALPEATANLLTALGITPAARTPAPASTGARNAASGSTPPSPAFDRTLVTAP